MGNVDFGGMLVIDEDIFEPHVLDVHDLVIVERTVSGEAHRLINLPARSGTKTKGNVGVKTGGVGNLRCFVLMDIRHQDERHAIDAT